MFNPILTHQLSIDLSRQEYYALWLKSMKEGAASPEDWARKILTALTDLDPDIQLDQMPLGGAERFQPHDGTPPE